MDQGANQFEIANPPADGISRVTFAPEDSSLLLVSSWDKVVMHSIDEYIHAHVVLTAFP